MASLLTELKRRNVFRVGLAYAVIAWGLAQVAEFAFENFGAPDWALKVFSVGLLLGLPLALIFAWAFEVTPEGIKLEKDVDRSQSITDVTGRKLDYVIIAGLSLVAVLLLVRILSPGVAYDQADDEITVTNSGNSVAVLPFADLSQQGDQEYFADGISEEILNVLVSIPGLKVAGRTSSFSFKGRNEDLREIGAALGVNHVLEGSVRRSGTRLRITAQLIRGEDGFHLWSETYDREVADIFEIQDEIARSVADQLAVSLGLSPESLVKAKTNDIVAYENYLRANQLFLQRGKENLDAALLLLHEAVARDPDFAPSWAKIAAIYTVYESYTGGRPATEQWTQWRAIGKAAAERAIALDPDEALGYTTRGAYLFFEGRYVESIDSFERAVELAPDNPNVLDLYAQDLLELGYFERAVELSSHGVSIDPLVPMFRNTNGRSFAAIGDTNAATQQFEKALQLDPSLPFPYNNMMRTMILNEDLSGLVKLAERAADAGAQTGVSPELATRLQESWGNEEALRELMASMPPASGAMQANILIRLGDTTTLLESLERAWASDYRPIILLMNGNSPYLYGNARWKQQVIADGLLDLWQKRGFPAHCRPLGDDDFECDSSLAVSSKM
jgi:TolB-like protein/Flp pilus assembly protein TadD